MTVPSSFQEINDQIGSFFAGQEYKLAYDLATRHVNDFPVQRLWLVYMRLCSAARLGQNDLAMQIIAEQLAAGEWFSEPVLRQSPSLAGLQGLPAYEALVARSLQMQQADSSTSPRHVVIEPANISGAMPYALVLHSNGSSAQSDQENWQSLAEAGWLVSLPNAPTQMWKGNHMWTEREVDLPVIEAEFAAMRQQYAIDPQRVIIAGHSMGAQLATWVGLSRKFNLRGFIAMGPWLPEEELSGWEALLTALEPGVLRGVIYYGADDHSIPHDQIEALAQRLQAAGIELQVKKFDGAGHDLTPEIWQKLDQAVEFIMK